MAEPISAFTFLSELYSDEAPGYLSLFLLPRKRTLWQRPEHRRKLLQEAKPYLTNQDVYFGIGLHGKIAEEGRGDEADVVGIPGLWCDLDIADPVHRIKNLPPDVEAVQTLVTHACPYLPSIVIHSGHGLQAYWLFRELWILETAEDREQAKQLCARLQASVQDLAKDQGWHVDSTFDLARIFRLPGTTNRKGTPVPVTCLSWDPQRRYDPSDFDDVLPNVETQVYAPTPSSGTCPEVPPIHALQISPRMKYLLRLGEDPHDPARYASRSEAEFAVLTALVGAGYSDSQIVGVMLDGSYALSDKPRERGERWILQEIARARAKFTPSPDLSVHRNGTTPPPVLREDPLPLAPALPRAAHLEPTLADEAAPWLEAYAQHSRKWSPRAAQGFHCAVGLWMLSTLAARRIRVEMGNAIYPTLFIALVARSTLYAKTTTAKIGIDGIRHAGCAHLLAADRSTPQALLRSMSGHVPSDYGSRPAEAQEALARRVAFAAQRGWYFEEWGGLLHQMTRKDSPMAEFHGLLRVLDDGYDSFESETIQRGLDHVDNPYLSLLASATPHDLSRFLVPGAPWWHDGFWPRIALIVPLPEERPSMMRRPVGNARLPGKLVEPLHTWHQRLGIPTVSIDAAVNASGKPTGEWHAQMSPLPCQTLDIHPDVKEAYDTYNESLLQLIINGDATNDLEACYGRLHDKALRISMLLASFAGQTAITLPYWAYAQNVTEEWRVMLHQAIAVASEGQPMSREEQLEQKIESQIARFTELTARDLHRHIRGFSSREINLALQAMMQAGRILEASETRTKRYRLFTDTPSPMREENADVPF